MHMHSPKAPACETLSGNEGTLISCPLCGKQASSFTELCEHVDLHAATHGCNSQNGNTLESQGYFQQFEIWGYLTHIYIKKQKQTEKTPCWGGVVSQLGGYFQVDFWPKDKKNYIT